MTLLDDNTAPLGQPVTLADAVKLLGHTRLTGIMHKPADRASGVDNYFVEPRMVQTVVDGLVMGDTWFGINEVREHPGPGRRATNATVARWCALWADLDQKDGGFQDFETIQAVIDAISDAYGMRPTWITMSGHGLQPVWLLDGNDPETRLDGDNGEHRTQAITLMKRHQRLVQAVAAEYGGDADSVFDLARVLRAPGTLNCKTDPKVEATAWRDEGTPMTVQQVRDALDAAGIVEMPTDGKTIHAPVVSAPTKWRPRTTHTDECRYATKMVDGWATANPPGRHQWLVAQATRLAAARRYGCLTATEEAHARRELEGRFRALCGAGPDARYVPDAEVRGALEWGEQLVATMTDAAVADELGDHEHYVPDADTVDDFRHLAPAPEPAAAPHGDGDGMDDSNLAALANTPTAERPAAGIGDDGRLHLGTYTPDNELEELEGDFWTKRPELQQIYRVALLSYTAPWAVLGQVIARTLAAIPPQAQLPPVGNYAGASRNGGSLNLHVAIMGDSGKGKGESGKVAAALSRTEGYEVRGVGSGEGLAAMYCGPDPDDKNRNIMVRTNILVSVPEVDAFARIADRNSSTLDVVLREAYSGERLGREYKGINKMPVEDHTYRMATIIGVQYARAGVLLNTASGDGGTAQRFIWMDTYDPRAQGVPAAVNAFYEGGGTQLPTITPPPYIGGSEWPQANRGEFIELPYWATAAIQQQRIANMCAPPDAEANLDSHSLFTRCKVAVALAAMAGRVGVTDEDWELSGTVMAVSRLTRERAAAALKRATRREAAERGELRGVEMEQARTTEKAEREAKVRRAGERVLAKLAEDGPQSRRELRQRTTAGLRSYLGDALTALVSAGRVKADEVEVNGQTKVVYTLAD